MTLSEMLAAHNDSALEALSSKGLLRRAKRDLEKGQPEIIKRDDKHAIVTTDGQQIQIDAKGPQSAQCTCPASGLCRHILLSVIALRDASDQITEPVSNQTSAMKELKQLSETDLIKFSGKDWSNAVTLAETSEAEIIEEELNCKITLKDSPVQVTFVAGQGLKGAIYKGPKTKARLLTATCAILFRKVHNIKIKSSTLDTDENTPGLPDTLLNTTIKACEDATVSVLAGVPDIAADHLFDLAISARIEAAPRLTSELRNLSKQCLQAATRHISFEPDKFLANIARTYALAIALKKSPDDPLLTGVLRRNYQDHEPLSLWMLGANVWHTKAGARGLTAYGYAPETKQWYTATNARAAGADPTFYPEHIYQLPIWGLGELWRQMGKYIHLSMPKISTDYQVSLNLEQNAAKTDELLTLDLLESSGALISNWRDLKSIIATRFGTGLKRQPYRQPALIKPNKYSDMGFDEFEQCYYWLVEDEYGQPLYLQLPGHNHELAGRVNAAAARTQAILIEAELIKGTMCYKPVSLLIKKGAGLDPININLDHLDRTSILGEAIRRLKNLAKFSGPVQQIPNQTDDLINALFDLLVDALLSPPDPKSLEFLRSKCEQSGLLLLTKTIDSYREQPTTENILKVAYVLEEIQFAIKTQY